MPYPHTHLAISVGYAGTVTLAAGGDLTDPYLYLAAAIGGEIIDILDHTLYQLVYGRNNPAARKARGQIIKGRVREGIRTLKTAEDNRQFQGLWLHNVYAISLIALIAIAACFAYVGTIYLLVFLGAFLLHQITDFYMDFKTVGHAENWIWNLPAKQISSLAKVSTSSIFILRSWLFLIVTGFILITLRWAFQIADQDLLNHLGFQLFLNPIFWGISIPLIAASSLGWAYFIHHASVRYFERTGEVKPLSSELAGHIIKPKKRTNP